MEDETRKSKPSVQRDVLKFLQANADVEVSPTIVAEATKHNRASVSTALIAIEQKYPRRVRRPGRGRYLWLTRGRPAGSSRRSTTTASAAVTMRVMRRLKDGAVLVESAGDLYVAVPLEGWWSNGRATQ